MSGREAVPRASHSFGGNQCVKSLWMPPAQVRYLLVGQMQERALHPGPQPEGWGLGGGEIQLGGKAGHGIAWIQKDREQGGLKSVTSWTFRALDRRAEMSSWSCWPAQALAQKLTLLCGKDSPFVLCPSIPPTRVALPCVPHGLPTVALPCHPPWSPHSSPVLCPSWLP